MPIVPIEQQPLPTQQQVQAQYDAASLAGVSPCMWVPPTWSEVQNAGGAFPSNSGDSDLFNGPAVIEEWKRHLRECEARRAPKGPESMPNNENWPNPLSDFSHIDDEEFPTESLKKIKDLLDPKKDVQKMDEVLSSIAGLFKDNRDVITAALSGDEPLFDHAVAVLDGEKSIRGQELQPVATLISQPGRIHDAVAKIVQGHALTFADVVDVMKGNREGMVRDRNTLNRLQNIVGPDSPGMKRLGQVFDWLLCRTTTLMRDLNDALENGPTAYNEARRTYINYLKDIDDHEPQLRDRPLDPTKKKGRSGYGRALKWGCIDPVIFEGRIVGVRVVMKWNPHSSSSGVPIPYP